MNTTTPPQFFLLWKGRQSGPFSVAAIRDMLRSGEISRIHQINYNNRWMLLDEFLEKHGAGDPEAQRRRETEKREAQSKRRLEKQFAHERTQQGVPEGRVAPALSNLLRPAAPPVAATPSSPPLPASAPPLAPLPDLSGAPFAPTRDVYFQNPQFLAMAGSTLLLFGAFTPVVSIPVVGGLTFLKLGWPAYIVIVMAFASLGVALTAKWQALWVTGGGAALILLGCLGAFFRRLYDAGDRIKAPSGQNDQVAKLGESLGNFVLDTIQLQWGCFILGVGVLLIMAAAYTAPRSSPPPPELSFL